MDIRYYRYPEKLNISHTAVALGYFDGVHVAHRELISLLVKKARENGLSAYVLTFENGLSKVKKTQSIIYNTKDKIKIFESLGVDGVIIADFDSVAELSGECFVNEVLIDSVGADMAISGYNFRFGKGASSSSEDLTRLMESRGKRAIILGEQSIGKGQLSSTVIRELISARRLDEANEMLGLPYFIEGMVQRGLGLGKVYGFPTLNIPVRENSPLPPGVYRTAVEIGEKIYTGVTNIGSCPTVQEREVHAETLIADFSGDLYGSEVRIYFLGYLREEKRFDSVDELREQIYKDRNKSIEENGDLTWLATGQN